MSFAMRTS